MIFNFYLGDTAPLRLLPRTFISRTQAVQTLAALRDNYGCRCNALVVQAEPPLGYRAYLIKWDDCPHHGWRKPEWEWMALGNTKSTHLVDALARHVLEGIPATDELLEQMRQARRVTLTSTLAKHIQAHLEEHGVAPGFAYDLEDDHG